MKQRFQKYLPLILKLNLTFLAGFVVLTFAFPLSAWERFAFILPAVTLAAITWAFVNHLRKRPALLQEQDPTKGSNPATVETEGDANP